MKKSFLYIFFLSLVATLFTSCAMYEDIYFAEDKSIKYEMTVDGNALFAMSSDYVPADLSRDTVVYIKDLIAGRKSISELSPEVQEDLSYLSNMLLKVKTDKNKKEFIINISGDFTNDDKLNKGLAAFDRLSRSQKDKVDATIPFIGMFSYSWNGKEMTKTVSSSFVQDKEDIGSVEKGISQILEKSDITLRYHFPKRVKSINKQDAIKSMDEKNITLTYPVSIFLSPENKDDLLIKITTE